MFESRINEWRKLVDSLPENQAILPSPPDPRDYSEPLLAFPLPPKVTLPVYKILHQEGTPFCGGASGAGAAGGFYQQHFSMTYLYWLCKRYDGIPDRPGTYLRTVCKVMNKYGCAPESEMQFSDRSNPEIKGFAAAKRYQVKDYYQVMTLNDMKTALVRGHYLLLATIVTAPDWRRDNGGWINGAAGEFRGGHATYLYGYDDNLSHKHEGYFLGGNSWGEQWGNKGKFYLPYDYLTMKHNGRDSFIEAWSLGFEPLRENPWLDYRDLHRAKRKLWG